VIDTGRVLGAPARAPFRRPALRVHRARRDAAGVEVLLVRLRSDREAQPAGLRFDGEPPLRRAGCPLSARRDRRDVLREHVPRGGLEIVLHHAAAYGARRAASTGSVCCPPQGSGSPERTSPRPREQRPVAAS
jgi:hypothetical protein